MEKDGSLPSDELERIEKELEKVTHTQVGAIDELLSHKERELLEV
jgi:ribosome recycling factor